MWSDLHIKRPLSTGKTSPIFAPGKTLGATITWQRDSTYFIVFILSSQGCQTFMLWLCFVFNTLKALYRVYAKRHAVSLCPYA